MLTKYFVDFHFCLHERKKHPFWESPFAYPVFGHLFLSKKRKPMDFWKMVLLRFIYIIDFYT